MRFHLKTKKKQCTCTFLIAIPYYCGGLATAPRRDVEDVCDVTQRHFCDHTVALVEKVIYMNSQQIYIDTYTRACARTHAHTHTHTRARARE